MLRSYNSALYVILYLIFRKSCLLLIGILLQFQWRELCKKKIIWKERIFMQTQREKTVLKIT